MRLASDVMEERFMSFFSKHPFSSSQTSRRSIWNHLGCIMVMLGISLLSASIAKAQCPAVGADTNCGVVITILQAGNSPCSSAGCFTISNNQGPFDEIEDTLVGIVNSSNVPITSLVLTSGAGGADIFGFDNDGICGLSPNTGLPYVPVPAGCPFGPTGYEGPGTSFSNISADQTTGTVTFSPPIPANGGTAYFSLEDDLTAATACSTVINNTVPPAPGGGTDMDAAFTPNNGYTIAQAAQLCGFTGFNWLQTVTHLPDPSPFCENNQSLLILNPSPFCNQTSQSTIPYPIHLSSNWTPFNDPPPNGYTYGFFNSYPFYYPSATIAADEASGTGTLCIEKNAAGTCLEYDVSASGTILNIHDFPQDPCFPGGSLVNTAPCGSSVVPQAQAYVGFTTHLAGINADGSAKDLGIGFPWKDTYNGGSSGSISTGSIGMGPTTGAPSAVVVTGSNEITSYQYPLGVGITGINGNTISPPTSSSLALVPGNQVSTTASGIAYSRVNQTFDGTLTITNLSATATAGPIQIVLDSLTSGETLANATSSFGGSPFLTVPSIATLAPGQSASASAQFQDPSNNLTNFNPVLYSGSFN